MLDTHTDSTGHTIYHWYCHDKQITGDGMSFYYWMGGAFETPSPPFEAEPDIDNPLRHTDGF